MTPTNTARVPSKTLVIPLGSLLVSNGPTSTACAETGVADLVTTNWQPNSQWWIYKRYADQTGLRTSVTAGSQVDAVAYQDGCAAKASIVIGNKGGVTGSVNVVIRNVPTWVQSAGMTKVVVERMPAGNAAVSAPTVVSS